MITSTTLLNDAWFGTEFAKFLGVGVGGGKGPFRAYLRTQAKNSGISGIARKPDIFDAWTTRIAGKMELFRIPPNYQ